MIEYAKVTGENVKLRIGAGTSFCTQEIIPDGSIVAITEYTDNDWCKVIHNSYTGYIMRKYLVSIDDDRNEEGNITITLSKECAKELYDAINHALMN